MFELDPTTTLDLHSCNPMATRRENGMGSMLRRKQRNDNSSPYKRRQPAPANNKLQSSSSLSSFLSFISGAFRRKSSERVDPESEQSEDSESATEPDEQPESDPELGTRPGRRIERDNAAADSLSRLGHSLQQSITQPKVLPPSSILPPTDHSVTKSASTSQLAPPTRPRRDVQPSFATVSRASTKRAARPSFPGGIGSYGGFSATAEPSPPPFTPSNPLENSFAANRAPPTSKFTFTARPPSENPKTSSEILAEFFAAKGKTPLTAEERRLVARLIAESDAESSKSQSPDADPYNGVPSFSFLKATFPAPERDSTSPSSSLPASESAPSVGSSVPARKRRPINYGGSKRSAAITKAGFTLREHQKLLEKQKAKQENVAPDVSNVGDKRGVRDAEEDGGGKRRRTNDGQSAAVEEPAKGGVAKLLSLSAQPSMPSPLRQMTKLNSPSPPRVVLRAQAPSPASPLSRVTSEGAPAPKPASTASPAKPVSTQSPAKPKPRKSLVADVMRDMLAEDKAREKQEKPVDTTVFANPYEDAGALPVVTAPKVRKPRRASARPAAKSSATVAKQENKPMSLIEKIEQTDVRPSTKKAKTDDAPPPTFTFTAASPKDVTPKARRPPPVVEEPSAPTESSEIEVIDLDEEPKHKSTSSLSNNRPSLSVDVANNANGGSKSMLGLPHRQRPSFSLHSPARPSPLREMSVPIEDEEDEIVEIPGPTGVPVPNGIPLSSSAFGSNPFSFSTSNSTSVFSAPIPPPAPTLAPAQLPNKTQPPKIDAPLFGSNKPLSKSDTPSFFAVPKPAEPKPEVPSFFAAPKPVEPKAEVPSFFKVPKPAETKSAPVAEAKPAPVPVVETKPAPAPVPEVKPAPASKPISEIELKSSAQTLPVSALPVFTFSAPLATSTPKSTESRAAADLPISKLPTFTFGSAAPAPAKSASFNWAAAGFKSAAPSGGNWTCGTCMLSNPASATEKCTVCDAKKPGAATESTPAPAPVPAPVAKTASFDWGAAGMKAPSAASGGSWTCTTCSLSNPASATEKCTVCDALKPGAAPAPAKTASFNWGAAGLKAPSAASGGSWTCSMCSLSNPASATEKCTVCDAKKPGAAPVVKAASFDWGAAGLKAPTSTGGWTCSTCGLANKDGGASKCSICDAAR